MRLQHDLTPLGTSRRTVLFVWRLLAIAALSLAMLPHGQTGQAAEHELTVVGQVVCSNCWGEADRERTPYGTAADLAAARECAARGVQRALAVRSAGRYELYLLYPGSYQPGRDPFLDLVAQTVRITGRLQHQGARRLLFVDRAERLGASPAASADGLAPELELSDLSGAPQRLSAWRGRIVVLNFWATFCPPCLRELPSLAAIQSDYAAQGVVVIGAATEPFEKRAMVEHWVRQKGVNFPIWMEGSTQQMEAFGLGTGLPATVIIDRRGAIAKRMIGALDRAALRAAIDRLLAAPGQPSLAPAAPTARSDR